MKGLKNDKELFDEWRFQWLASVGNILCIVYVYNHVHSGLLQDERLEAFRFWNPLWFSDC